MASFCLNDYDCIAFDMDHTLIQYDLPQLSQLIYKCLVEYLRKEKDYDPSVLSLDNFEKYQDLCMRGVIFDYRKGNLIKIDSNGYVLLCCHGLLPMTDSEIEAEYGVERLWSSFSTLKETLSNGIGYAVFENFYTTPAIPLISLLVDYIDKRNNGRPQNYSCIWKDIAEAFNLNFSYTSFKARKGVFMPALISQPEKYVKKCPEATVEWIKKLRETKITVLITYTFANLAEHLMTYVIGADWKEHFDFIIGYAKKPSFFEESCKDNPFYTMTESEEISEDSVSELQPHTIYLCGSSRRLEKEVARYLKRDSLPKFVYFGDSMKSDVYAPAFHTQWDAVAVLEELQWAEELTTSTITCEDEPPAKKKSKQRSHSKSMLDKLFIFSERWGSLFTHKNKNMNCDAKQNNKSVSTLNTFWGHVIGKYSKLAIPLLDYIIDLPLDHKFSSFGGDELGFYT